MAQKRVERPPTPKQMWYLAQLAESLGYTNLGEAAARLGYDPARLTVTSATALIGELKEAKRAEA